MAPNSVGFVVVAVLVVEEPPSIIEIVVVDLVAVGVLLLLAVVGESPSKGEPISNPFIQQPKG